VNRFLTPAALALALAACAPRPSLDAVDPDPAVLGAGLPKGFVMGAATAAHQVEGGLENDWSDFERQPGRIKHGDVSGLAADSWNRFEDDLALLKQLGAKSYRFSVEWSRLEPQQGQWDEAALARYVQWTRRLREEGIEPLVTIWHFTLPKWVAASNAFENPANSDALVAFTEKVATALGPTVDWYITLNEPNVYAAKGYLQGEWPPGLKGETKRQAEVMANLLRVHGRMAEALRRLDTTDADGDGHATRISVAHHARIFQPASSSTLDTAVAGLTDDFINESIPRALVTGRLRLSVPGTLEIDEQVPGLAGSIDFLGLNYYSRDMVRADLSTPALSNQYLREGRPTSDMGWDLYPDGMYLLLMRFSTYGVPLIITENGLADATGEHRPKFLTRHLEAVRRATEDGATVLGYNHWALIDNFEWAEGYEPRFGLFRVDFENGQARSPTAAVTTFQKIVENLPR
jgi:beta-glucosidase